MAIARLTNTVAAGVLTLLATAPVAAQAPAAGPAASGGTVTFARHIAPILQRSCQQCHNPEGGAPMSLTTYEEVRPWARMIKQRTGLGPRAGVMPPWFVEKNIGIQRFKGDPSLSEEEIATIAKWADSGAPRGNVADLPPAKARADGRGRLAARQARPRREDRPRSSCRRWRPTSGGRSARRPPA